jgi:hypothetical protein
MPPGGYGPPPGSTPPPFGMPGGTPPPFGMPTQPPPPRRSNSGALLAAIIGGGLLLVVLIAVVAFVLVRSGEKSATEQLSAAATQLSPAKAVTLRGTFGTGSDRIEGDVKVTSGGRATGPVNWSGDQLTLLSTDGNVFVKADKTYWSKTLSSSNLDQFLPSGERWGRIENNKLPFDFKANVTPAVLASKLRSVTKLSVKSEVETTLQGRKANKITTIGAVYYLSDESEPRLLRVENISPAYAVDVTPQSAGDATATVNELRTRIGELRNAFDSTKSARVAEIKGCVNRSVSGCTVQVRVSTIGGDSNPTQASVYVWITATTPNPGKRLGTCTANVTVPPNGSEWTECRVSSDDWADFFGNTRVDRKWIMRANTIAAGTSSDTIQNMQDNLTTE